MAKSQLPDALLVDKYVAGDENALAILINRHQSKIYGYIYSKVSDRDVTEDIFQETFFKVIHTLKSRKYYNEEGKFLSWVLRIASNLIIDKYRNDKKMPLNRDTDELLIFSRITDDSLNIERRLIKNQVEIDIKTIIEKLPHDQKEVIMMRYFLDMSFKEIADFTGVSVNTTLGRMRYAITNLRKVIEKNKIYLPS
ncbi:sigma-70 family RNA polymerase sigma factor [Flavobacterium sp. J49]|uniref:RNA polymerase sigma factor n=1 Tax=Flavobacterium sp. J49 TaxID=2718534 RepID=UPI001593BED2|nr:sigma-70 family RNA polymerase sigma factor [Flavobacterium sp. J49]MBF6640164.1 sigma-70 family RNA polymerase sigma factor [Flavobacterium sp. J49]NIC01409.1 sigma-70 family RNA polymerase sigma factor [Flavobacterium sp. J49]